MWYTDWGQAGGRDAEANMDETDGERLTLKQGAPGDQVWDLLCVQLASYLERGPLMWMMPLHLHVNQKSDYDDMVKVCIRQMRNWQHANVTDWKLNCL